MVAIQAEVVGDSDYVEFLGSDAGEFEFPAEGDNWRLHIAQRGEGICTRQSTPLGEGERCFLVDQWFAPGIFDLSQGVSWTETGAIAQHDIIGLVGEEIDSVVVYLDDGTAMSLVVDDPIFNGIKGVGGVFGPESGQQTRFEAWNEDSLVGAVDLEPSGTP